MDVISDAWKMLAQTSTAPVRYVASQVGRAEAARLSLAGFYSSAVQLGIRARVDARVRVWSLKKYPGTLLTF